MDLLKFYKAQTEKILSFWMKEYDDSYGGVFTCINDAGELLNTDKYVWSQGRYLWLLSKAYELSEKGMINTNKTILREQADSTAKFLLKSILDNGNVCFLLSREGCPKKTGKYNEYENSTFADCFVVIGIASYIHVFGMQKYCSKIWKLYERIEERISEQKFRTDPYPISKGMKAHSVPMIMLSVIFELKKCFKQDEKSKILRTKELWYLKSILKDFCDNENRILEILTLDNQKTEGIIGRHLNPGHTIEDTWFMYYAAGAEYREQIIDKLEAIIKAAIKLGWDEQYGGLFRYVDYESGGKPNGEGKDDFSKLISETWDYKLWWPHAESLYALLLFGNHAKDSFWKEWYVKMHQYVFSTFPDQYEWSQILDRKGKKMNKVVALPVKDPYHILRALFLIVELLNLKDIDSEWIHSIEQILE